MATGRVGPLQNRIDILLRDPSIETAVKRWALSALEQRASDRQRILRDGGYEDYVLEHIQQACDNLKDENHSRQRVCTCTDSECALKNWRIQPEIQDASSVDEGIRTVRQTHPGNPLVLGEAQQAWGDLVSAVEQDLRTIMLHLSDETIPADAGTDESPPTSPAVGQSVAGPDHEDTSRD